MLAGLFISAFAEIAAPYEVGPWGNFCQGAVTFTFDDNCPNQLSIAQPLFDAKGFHVSYFPVIKWGPNWSKYVESFNKGHEIGSHSVNHGDPMPASEAGPSQDTIKKNIPGEKCVSIAYPNCKEPDETTLKKYYIAGRTCSGAVISKTSNLYQAGSYICGSTGSYNSTQSITTLANNAASSKGWVILLMHAIDEEPSGSSTYSPIKSQIIKEVVDFLDANRSKIWVETMGNVARYIKESGAVSIAKKDSTDKAITISVTDNLPDSIFNYPLTIRRPLPTGWTSAFVSQKGKPVLDTIVTVNSQKYVMFQAIPDSGDVIISPPPTSIKNRSVGLGSNGSMPVKRLRSTLLIDRIGFSGSGLQVTLFSLQGQELGRYGFGKGESQIVLPLEKVSRSALIVKVAGASESFTGTFLPQM
jgi:oligosaccharide reducing-end xylanase